MGYVDLVEDTICALITAPGLSGISVIRVSGSKALSIVRQFCKFLPDTPESHKVFYGDFKNKQEINDGAASQTIDEVLATYFAKGRSFTGDETLEISTHGGYAAANRVLAELLSGGCRAAERGEFSFRAFYNGKIDMVQAEGVLSIINSRTDQARDIAMKQLKGQLSGHLEKLEVQLVSILAQLEASIDFSTEDIDPYTLEEMKRPLFEAQRSCEKLVNSFGRGKVISSGIKAVLAGPPNVGKSSLYNSLLGQEKAIVTDIAGTTRDLLETEYKDFGMPIALVDSAGLRDSDDAVEKIGIARAHQSLDQADLIFFVLEVGSYSTQALQPILPYRDKTFVVFNKIDRLESIRGEQEKARVFVGESMGSQAMDRVFFTSTINGEGIQNIKSVLEKMSSVDIEKDEALITQHRHFDHLSRALQHLKTANQLMNTTESYDLIALEVQTALKEVFAVLGKEYDEQVLDQVFKQFCIGK